MAIKHLKISFFCCTLLAGCGTIHQPLPDRMANADIIAKEGLLTPHVIRTNPYTLQSYSRINDPALPIRIYIEGDGFAYVNRSRPSSDPTPIHPVGLYLAAADGGPNVAYLARPCQYGTAAECKEDDWTTQRFSRAIIDTYHQALSRIKNDEKAEFELVGFSGGANIAGILAAERHDTVNLRTVAGNVDNDFFTEFHQVSAMPYSLNMTNYAGKLATMPQIHFIAEDDRFVPSDIYTSYERKLSFDACTDRQIVNKTTHLDGWRDQWAYLLQEIPTCK